MENWNNLNRLLDINIQNAKRKEEEALLMVDLCQKGEKEGVRALLKSGAAVNCFADNLTPLLACVESDNYDLAVFLLNAGASIAFRGADTQEDALWYSLKNKKLRFLSLFVERRCQLTLELGTNTPALIYCTKATDVRGVETLLSHARIRVNERDGAGRTALHHNVSKENHTSEDAEIGRMLIAAGADANMRDLDGKTPEDLATEMSARSMLLAAQMENTLESKEVAEKEPEITKEQEEELSFDNESSVEPPPPATAPLGKTNSRKIKI